MVSRAAYEIVSEIEPPFAAGLQKAASLQPTNPLDKFGLENPHGGAEQLRFEVAHRRGCKDNQFARRLVETADSCADQRVEIPARSRNSLSAGGRQFREEHRISAALAPPSPAL